jgi:phage gpG-like protein
MAETIETNAPEIAARLNRMAATLQDPTPVLERARRLIAAQEEKVWQSDGAALGEHWAQAAEPERKIDSRLLVATGALRGSVTSEASIQIYGTELRAGTDVPYGIFHQYGTSKMPARQFLGIAPDLARRLVALYEQAIEDQAARA